MDAVSQSGGERTKGFSETSSVFKCGSPDCHPAHPGVNEAEITHADVLELTIAECMFHVTHPALQRCNSIS